MEGGGEVKGVFRRDEQGEVSREMKGDLARYMEGGVIDVELEEVWGDLARDMGIGVRGSYRVPGCYRVIERCYSITPHNHPITPQLYE